MKAIEKRIEMEVNITKHKQTKLVKDTNGMCDGLGTCNCPFFIKKFQETFGRHQTNFHELKFVKITYFFTHWPGN